MYGVDRKKLNNSLGPAKSKRDTKIEQAKIEKLKQSAKSVSLGDRGAAIYR